MEKTFLTNAYEVTTDQKKHFRKESNANEQNEGTI